MKQFSFISVILLLITAPSWSAEGNNDRQHTIRGSHELDGIDIALNRNSRNLQLPISGVDVPSSDESTTDNLPSPKAKTTTVVTLSVESEKSDPEKTEKAFRGESTKTKKAKTEKQIPFEKLKKDKGDPKSFKGIKSFKGFKSDKAKKDKLTKFEKSMPDKKDKSKKV